MNFRPSTRDRIRHAWTQYRPSRQTLARSGVAACLALGAIGGAGQIAAFFTSEDTITASQADADFNRGTAVGGFADTYVDVFLAGGSATALAAFTSADITPSPVPVSVIKSIPYSVARQPSGYANVESWSVVIGALVKPSAKAPELQFYQVPVAVVQGTPRATTAPAFVNGPDIGFDADLDYPSQVSQDSPAYSTVADFLDAWLKSTPQQPAGGDISRYSISPNIRPFNPAPFTSVTVDSINAHNDIPADAKNGFTTKILVTAHGSTKGRANETLTYPLAIVRQSDKWFISDIDLTPQLGGRITKATPTSTPTQTPTR